MNATPQLRLDYDWTQTRSELTLTLALPAETPVRSVRCTVTPTGALSVQVAGQALLHGQLHGKAELNTWTVDGSTLSIEIDKAAPKFWPCATVGGPAVDVKQLLAEEKREREPAFKPVPNELQPARRVTDREELQKLQAEFPELGLDLGPKPHAADHRSYSGTRRDFEWGAIPVAEVAASAPAAPAVPSPAAAIANQPTTAPSRAAGAGSAAATVALSSSDPVAMVAVPAELSGSTFSWGEVNPSSAE